LAYKRTKGAVKLHLLLDHQGYLPQFMVITPGKTQEIEVARRLRFQPGTILIMDRADVDYTWFERLTRQGVYFVTRLRCDARYQVQEERSSPQRSSIQANQIIRLGVRRWRQPSLLRRIVVEVPDWDQPPGAADQLWGSGLQHRGAYLSAIARRWKSSSALSSRTCASRPLWAPAPTP